MDPTNGKVVEPSAVLASPPVAGLDARRLGMAMIPFTPVSFRGAEAPLAWLRLGVYGVGAYMAWGKARRLSYLLAGAAVVSTATSMAGTAWNGEKNASA